MSGLRVTFKLTGERASRFQEFCDLLRKDGNQNVVQLSRDQIAEKLVFMSINQAYGQATKMKEESERGNNEEGITTGHSQEAQILQTTDSSVSSSQEANGNDSEAGIETSTQG